MPTPKKPARQAGTPRQPKKTTKKKPCVSTKKTKKTTRKKNKMGTAIEREKAAHKLVNMLWTKIAEEKTIEKPTLRNRLWRLITGKNTMAKTNYPSIKLLPNELELEISKYLVNEHPRKKLARKVVADLESILDDLVTSEEFIAVDDVIEILLTPRIPLTFAEVLRAGRAHISIELNNWTPKNIREVQREHIGAIKSFIETHDWDHH